MMSLTSIGLNLARSNSLATFRISNVITGTSGVNLSQTRWLRVYKEKLIRLMYWRGKSFDLVKFDHKRSDMQDWNYKTEIFAFSRRLQENLSEETLRRTFTHPSYINSLKEKQDELDLPLIKMHTNEELVDRGFELLDDVIKPYLRQHFDKMPEEGITAVTGYLKSEKVLADIAKWIGCKDLILSAEWPPSPQCMAVTVPAVVAGIEKDLGPERARRFVVDIIISYINDLPIAEKLWNIPHPKETLNLILFNSDLPNYEPRIIFQTGVNTLEACHNVGVYSNKQFLGSSPGETLEIAEECACLDALLRLFDLNENRRPFKYGETSEKIDYSLYSKPNNSLNNWKFKLVTSS